MKKAAFLTTHNDIDKKRIKSIKSTTMKNAITTIIALCAILPVSAQFKVTSDGTAHVKDTLTNGHAMLTIGHDPETGATVGNTSIKAGTHIYTNETSASFGNYGLISTIENQSHTYNRCYGVWGEASGANGFNNFGVVGSLFPNAQGAAIYGTTEGGIYPMTTSGDYAGYFYGNVCVDGPLTAYSLYVISDETRMANATSLSDTSLGTRGSTLDNLLSLDVKSFNLKQQEEVRADASRNISDSQAEHINQVEKAKSMQQHFGISAQELQKVYPELVMEQGDGSLVVNYVEMVPLLLRSIQELKAEVEELKASETVRRSPVQSGIQTIASSVTGAQLFQNKPNPFSERAVIRFSLPENTSNAQICIFDMTGKMLKKLPVSSGMDSVSINGYDLGEGIYLYSLVVGGQEVDTKRMIVTK